MAQLKLSHVDSFVDRLGIRKAAARCLAEAGCTEHEIMSITGHESLKEVERYTKAASQERLAKSAISKLEARTANSASQTFAENVPNPKKV